MTEERFFDGILYVFAGVGGAILLLILCIMGVAVVGALWKWMRGVLSGRHA